MRILNRNALGKHSHNKSDSSRDKTNFYYRNLTIHSFLRETLYLYKWAIDQASSVKVAGYWPSSFSCHKHAKKRRRPISSHLDRTRIYYMGLNTKKGSLISRDQVSGIWFILPAHGATIVVKRCWEGCGHQFSLHLIRFFSLMAEVFRKYHALVVPPPPYSMLEFFWYEKSPFFLPWKIQH